MGRGKSLSREKLQEATSGFEQILKSYRKATSKRQETLLKEFFTKIFENRVTEERLQYGHEQIKYLFAPTSKFQEPPNVVILKSFEKECQYLTKHKAKIPSYYLSLLSMDLINEIIKRFGISPKDENVLEVVKRIHVLTEISSDSYAEEELTKTIPLSVIDHVLTRAEYDLNLRAMIYRSEKKRLKKDFRTYNFIACNEWPYYLYNRYYKADTLFQYLYFLWFFQLHTSLTKKSPYPPKRIVALECLQAIRKNSCSTGKIYSEIQSILDPDHSSNQGSFST